MAFAIVHFTAGFVVVLILLSLIPITRYRLTGAYVAGIWALVPDIHHFLEGPLSIQAYALHNDSLADIFFFHYFLDKGFFRTHNFEFTFISLSILGSTFLIYDWRFGVDPLSASASDTVDVSDQSQ